MWFQHSLTVFGFELYRSSRLNEIKSQALICNPVAYPTTLLLWMYRPEADKKESCNIPISWKKNCTGYDPILPFFYITTNIVIRCVSLNFPEIAFAHPSRYFSSGIYKGLYIQILFGNSANFRLLSNSVVKLKPFVLFYHFFRLMCHFYAPK